MVLFINDVDQIKTLSSNEKEVLKKYWPGQLTIIKNKEAYRVPASKKILSLIKRIGPLYSSSANLSGRTPIIKTIDTINEFGFDQLKNIYVVKGKQKDHYPSTIVDFDNLTVLRRGRVDGQKVLDDLKEIK